MLATVDYEGPHTVTTPDGDRVFPNAWHVVGRDVVAVYATRDAWEDGARHVDTYVTYRGTVWGGVTVWGRTRPAYVSDAGAFIAPDVAAPWRAMTAAERVVFVPDWRRTRDYAHTDAAYTELRAARAADPTGPDAREACRKVNAAHGW